MQLAAAVAADPWSQWHVSPLAARAVLVDQEIIKVVAQVAQQVQALAALYTPKTPAPKTPAPKTPAPKTPAPKTCVPGKCSSYRDITQRTVIIIALMELKDAFVQIHTNAQSGQLS